MLDIENHSHSFRLEQIEIEHQVRRKYDKKWGEVSKAQHIRTYDPDYVDSQLKDIPSRGNSIN